MEELKKWKDMPDRKPLIIEGARQTGKTWLMREFGRTEYDDCVYINFDANRQMRELFAADLDISRLIIGIEIYAGRKIDRGRTLLIFDEVQEAPRALASLKYFREEAPEYSVVCAGSLLGIALHEGTSYPVGKVDTLRLRPMTFGEFLTATGRDRYARLCAAGDFEVIAPFGGALIEALKQYYFVGGMPEAVARFADGSDFGAAREVQRRILDAYEQDFSKHAPAEVVPKLRMVWNAIPSQLARENRKFVYGLLREGGRAREFETAIMWLADCGLAHKIPRVTAGRLPLAAYEDLKAFKLYMLDVGLLGCMAGLGTRTILDGSDMFTEFKGALTEQYVIQQLIASGRRPYYYTNDRGNCEVDAVFDDGERVIPLEVKAERNLKAKSLRTFVEKFGTERAYRVSMADYRDNGALVDLPLYMMDWMGG